MQPFPTESERQNHWINFLVFPWLVLPVFATAVTMSVLYLPPLGLTALVLLIGLLGGAARAYGGVIGSRRLASAMMWVLPVMILINLHERLPFDARCWTVFVWFFLGLITPTWIWRKRGLERFAPAAKSTAEE